MADFKMNMDEMREAANAFIKLKLEADHSIQRVEDAISKLCDQGWSGQQRDEYLNKIFLWSIQSRSVINKIYELKFCINKNLPAADTLLQEGQSIII